MKTLRRNHIPIWYSLATGQKVRALDEYGNYTGEMIPEYTEPVLYTRLSTRNRKGEIKAKQFGLADEYVESFVTDDMGCPIKQDTRLWVDSSPYDDQGNALPHTHVVDAVIPSLNVIRIVAMAVSVSP